MLISGYYGFDNLGDEAVLLSIVKTLRSLDGTLEITVLSARPEVTAERYGVRAVNRTDFFAVLRSIFKCDMLISGGGSLFQDVTSRTSLLYYLSIVFLGILFRKKVMVYGQGLGPLINNTDRKITSFILRRVDMITLRDNSSFELLKELGIEKNVHITADPVFTLEPSPDVRIKELLKSEGVYSDYILVAPRDWYNNELFRVEMAKALDQIYLKTGAEIVFCPFHESDIEESRSIADFMKCPHYILPKVYNPEDMLGIISLSQMVIGVRLHSLIFGALAGRPIAGISYDPKINGFLKDIGVKPVGVMKTVTADQIVEYVEAIWDIRDKVGSEIKDKVEILKQKAHENGELAISLIGGGRYGKS
ncbi:MAG: polysaccharide pyruvyl transferase CsaB [Thermoanaerobacteraceae bacterium]|nr:polysaccharide pyruvyl transferase CsaB [Thermoanaerobacteraceae bacterium]